MFLKQREMNLGAFVSIKPLRREICDTLYVCLYTCDQYYDDFNFNKYGLMCGFQVPEKYQCQYKEIVNKSKFYQLRKDVLNPNTSKTKGTVFRKDGVYEDGILTKQSQEDSENE